jgi:hypothetical protein
MAYAAGVGIRIEREAVLWFEPGTRRWAPTPGQRSRPAPFWPSSPRRPPQAQLGLGFLAERRLATTDLPDLDERGGLRPEEIRLEEVAGGCASEARQDP